jgi:hypothetical protein
MTVDPRDINRDGIVTEAEIAQYAKLASEAAKLGINLTTTPTLASGNGRTSSSSSESSSSTSSDVQIYSLNQVRNVATSAFETALGRTPSQAELNKFVTSLNAFSKANPVKTTKSGTSTSSNIRTSESNRAGTSETITDKPTSTSSTSSTSSGGVDVAAFAASQVEDTVEAKAVRVDSLFRGAMDILSNRIGG